MKKKGLIVGIIDNSGSMSLILKDAIGGFNTFKNDQAQAAPDNEMTLVYFNSVVEPQFTNKPLKEVDDLTRATYVPGGLTALYDGVGSTIDGVGAKLAAMPEKERPNKVVFAILTDGEENSSKEYSAQQVKDKIEHQRTKYSWEFIFLAASEQGLKDGAKMGIHKDDMVAYAASAEGVHEGYAAMSAKTTRALS